MVSTFLVAGASASETTMDTSYADKAATVKYLGTDQESYVFNVTYNNEKGDRFLLRIMDAGGNVLYTGSYNDKKFDKRFRLAKEGNEKISFVIRNLKDNSVQAFSILTTIQVIEDVVVTKVEE